MTQRRALLARIKMERFGRFSDLSLGPFDEELTVVAGENEAGKSTTTGFIAQLLYGWNRKVASGNHYGIDGGQRKGSLIFSAPQGEWELTRNEGTAQRPTSVLAHRGLLWDDAFDALTAGVDKDTYASIFAFDSEQLRDLSTKGEVAGKLVTAESATPVAPVDARDAIQAEMQRFTGNAVTSTFSIPRARARILELQELVAQLRAQERARIDERVEMQDLERDVEELRVLIAGHEVEIARISACISETGSLRDRLREAQTELAASKDALAEKTFKESQFDQDVVAFDLAEEAAAFETGIPEVRTRLEDIETEQRTVAALSIEIERLASVGCTVGPSLRAEIFEKRDTLLRLETDLANRKQALDAARVEESGARARVEQCVGQTAGPRNPSRMVIGALSSTALALVVAIAGVLLASRPLMVAGLAGALVALCVAVAQVLGAGRRISSGSAETSQNEILSAELELRGAAGRRGEAEEALAIRERDLVEFRLELGSYLEARGLDSAAGDPALALALLENEEKAISLKQELAEATARLAVQRQRLDSWLAGARALLLRLEPLSGEITVHEAISAVVRAAVRGREAKAAEQVARGRRHEVVSAQERLDRAQRQLVHISEGFASLVDLGPGAVALPEVEGALARLRSEVAARREEMVALAAEREQKSTRRDAISGALGEVEHERRLQETQAELAQQEALLSGYIVRYTELLLAKRILEEALGQWEAKKQPEIYRKASDFFRRMTNGRWIEVRAGQKPGEIAVVDENYSVKKPGELSTGTVQQLYLALRMALLDANPEVGPSLPVVMDDPFVHFDPERRVEAVRAVAEFSRRRQVVFFTCDPETAGLFAQAKPNHTRIDL